ncbi:hypothetical protein Clacol_002984 [Clathrus columnatus]|uniref:Uncharacterized protein n=1 Tax=Clathrus columnatus TaxID=1419009 RepID=A0AAV5A720_9AGAM|nr:hypothetical protein Clacol_002984 [Clathrus columnatus]
MPTNYLQKAKRASTTALLQTLPLYNEPIEINDSRYKSSTVFPWNPPEKRLELFHQTSRFLIIYPDGGDLNDLIAFTMFRFEREDNAEGRPQNPRSWSYSSQSFGGSRESLAYEKGHVNCIIEFITDEISPDDEEYLILSKST